MPKNLMKEMDIEVKQVRVGERDSIDDEQSVEREKQNLSHDSLLSGKQVNLDREDVDIRSNGSSQRRN